MKEKSSSKRIKLEINSFENVLFKKLTTQELKEIKGGSTILTSPIEFPLTSDFIFSS